MPHIERWHGPEEFMRACDTIPASVDAALSAAEIAPGVYDRAGMHPSVEVELDRQLARGLHAFAPTDPVNAR